MKVFRIFDNFLNENDFKKIKESFFSSKFPWYFNMSKVSQKYYGSPAIPKYLRDYDKDMVDQHQFIHNFLGATDGRNAVRSVVQLPPTSIVKPAYRWSKYQSILRPLLDSINPRYWLRIKANMTSVTPKNQLSGWHNDMNKSKKGKGEKSILEHNMFPYTSSQTMIFYLNTNDGYTLIQNKELEKADKVDSIENRLVLFPNDTYHTGASSTDTKTRVVLNLNFVPHEFNRDDLKNDLFFNQIE